MGKPRTAIEPIRADNYPEWYQQVIKAADLAESSPVRGCMVIKPHGYALWENMQRVLDRRFKDTGHENAYFPLFIPKSFLEKEAKHVDGFATECAVVTHHRLEKGPDGTLVPAGKLAEPLIVRPTSETIIGEMFSKWVQSYRDLPLLINQWANVVRWELRTRMFLRTTEFLWQEGHTAHATADEAQQETEQMLDVYAEFAEQYMAMPVIRGRKSERERFPGAVETYSIEAMMQDRKALQSGTSHFLGQNFSRAADISFLDADGKQQFAYTTSWGVSTRLVGGLIMTHGDDDGILLPPKLAPIHVVIVAVIQNEEARADVTDYCETLASELRAQQFDGKPIEVKIDARDINAGERKWQWVKKGIPIRVEVGPRDIAKGNVVMNMRTKPANEKEFLSRDEFVGTVVGKLEAIQAEMFQRALDHREANTRRIDTKDELYAFFTPKNKKQPEIHGGFALCHWNGSGEVEDQLKTDLNVTIRCIPMKDQFGYSDETGTCVISGEPSSQRVVMAKAY